MTTKKRSAADDEREKQNRALYDRIRDGDASAVNLLVEANLDLPERQAKAFLKQHPEYRSLMDDLICEGSLNLVENANYFSTQREPVEKVREFLATAIWHAVSEAAERSAQFGPAPSTKRKRRSDGDEKDIPRRDDVDLDSLATEDGQRRVDMCEQLAACCDDETDRQIVGMRESGFSCVEIAGKLGISDKTVRNRRNSIKTKWLERQAATGA